ncbi:hypothetical protein Avbf_17475 [Armadillidium vulgare]|nr:hypothetical protein Avbf_17475 [Armadillidium vulgare]
MLGTFTASEFNVLKKKRGYVSPRHSSSFIQTFFLVLAFVENVVLFGVGLSHLGYKDYDREFRIVSGILFHDQLHHRSCSSLCLLCLLWSPFGQSLMVLPLKIKMETLNIPITKEEERPSISSVLDLIRNFVLFWKGSIF